MNGKNICWFMLDWEIFHHKRISRNILYMTLYGSGQITKNAILRICM